MVTVWWRTSRIIPAYDENEMNYQKVASFAAAMRRNDYYKKGHWGFPPIAGYFDTVTEEDLGKAFLIGSLDVDSEEITPKHLGQEVFRVTDGNHRVLAAVRSGMYQVEVTPDMSGAVGGHPAKTFYRYKGNVEVVQSISQFKGIAEKGWVLKMYVGPNSNGFIGNFNDAFFENHLGQTYSLQQLSGYYPIELPKFIKKLY